MHIDLKYNPLNLTYEQFIEINQECFPDEPHSPEMFNEMRMNHIWTAFNHNDLVGYAYVRPETQAAHLSRICVSKRFRRMGIAGQLMKALIDYCKENKKTTIQLYVQTDNSGAIELYKRFEFQDVDKTYQFIVAIHDFLQDHKGRIHPKLQSVVLNRDNISNDNKGPNKLPERFKLQFVDEDGNVQGNCHLDPNFPGCLPFVINHPETYCIDALLSIEKYLNPAQSILKLTFSGDQLAKTCTNLGFKLNYQLSKMEKRIF